MASVVTDQGTVYGNLADAEAINPANQQKIAAYTVEFEIVGLKFGSRVVVENMIPAPPPFSSTMA